MYGGERVEIGRLDDGMPVGSEVVVAQGVEREEDDVRGRRAPRDSLRDPNEVGLTIGLEPQQDREA